MKRSPPASATWTWPVVALLLLASALAGYPQAQKKSATSTQEKPEALLAAAMEKMSTGVWSVNGTVAVKKTIKLHGLLSGEDFDLTMEPGVNPNTPMREIVIKDKAWICSDGETWHAGSPDDRLLYNRAHVQSWSTGGCRPLKRWAPNNATGRLYCTCGSRCRRKKSIQRSYHNIGSCSIPRGKLNTSATQRCRCSHRPKRKFCTAHSITRQPRKTSRRRHWARQSMTRRMAFTISSNTSLIGKARSFAFR